MARRYPLLTFMLVACGYSWSLWFLMIASSRGWVPFRVPTGPLGSFGPLIAAFVLARPSGRWPSLRSFLRSSFLTAGPRRWLIVGLLVPLVITLVAILAQRIAAGSLPPAQGLDRFYLLPPIFLLILVLGGPLGEEPGWRGHVLPILLERYTPLVASLVLASFWLLWHLPLFWLEGAAQEGTSIAGFALMVAAASVLFTWVFLHTAPSLLAVLLLHTSINVWSFLLPSVLPGVDEARPFTIAFLAVFALAALVAAGGDRRMRERLPVGA